jgi:Carboxypeptidase regulatory-like domain
VTVGRPFQLLRVLGLVGVVLPILAASGYAQGGTTATLSGIVVDVTGGVVPGADVVAKHVATGVTTASVSNADGVFSFPALNVGTYTVTVHGFFAIVSPRLDAIEEVTVTTAAQGPTQAGRARYR